MVDLQTEYVQSRERVRIYDAGQVILAKLAPGKRMHRDDIHAAVDSAVEGCGEVLDVGQNGTGNSSTVTVRPLRGCNDQVSARLLELGWNW